MAEMTYSKAWEVHQETFPKINKICIFIIIKKHLITKEIQKCHGLEERNEG